MSLNNFFNSHENKTKERVHPVQALASKFNADYHYGINEDCYLFFSDISDEMKECNVIIGESEGYEYCFLEYYHLKSGKNDSSKWITKYSLRLNDLEFPDLELQTRKSALNGVGCMLFFGLPFLGIPVFIAFNFIFAFIKSGMGISKETLMIPIVMGLILLFFLVILGFIAFIFFGSAIDTLKKIKNQNQYCIRNPLFREKYVILTDVDKDLIRKVFNEKVCSRVVNFRPEIDYIRIHKGCISGEFSYNEQLSYNNCSKYISKLTKEAKIFERDEEDFDSSF